MREVYDLVSEPRDDLLRALLFALAPYASSVVMVLRDDLETTDCATKLVSELEPFLLARERASSWPGTALLDDEATILRFAATREVLAGVLAAANGLYDWQQPDLPEDLALLRDDGTPILASVAHERDGFLELSNEEYLDLLRTLPGLSTMTRRRPADRSSSAGRPPPHT